MSFFISPALAADAPAGAPDAGMFNILFLVGFGLIFYFFMWRPQAKRAKEHKNLLAGLSTGDEVVTGGGILGKVKKVTDEFVVLEVGDSQELKFQKGSIVAVLPKGTLKAI